jgi:galactonate dehydratase
VKIERVEGIQVGSDIVGGNFLVRVVTDSGAWGLGQSAAWGFPDAVEAVVNQFRDYLVGQDPFRIEHINQSLYRLRPFRGAILMGAVSAIDIALWDLKARHFGVPVWELLGGKVRDSIRLCLNFNGPDPSSIATQAKAAIDDGFTAIKLDPIRPGYADMSIPRLVESTREMAAAARETVGPDVDILFEFHRKLTPMNAITVANALIEFRPLYFEDPIQIDSIELQAELARRTSLPLANGERLSTIWEFRDLFAAGGPQYVRPDIGTAGGFTGCRKIAAIAEAHHSAVSTHNFLGTLLTAASVHLDASIPNFIVQEYSRRDESTRPADALFKTAMRRVGGYIPVPDAPGLGVELDESLLPAAPAAYMARTVPLRRDGSPAQAV